MSTAKELQAKLRRAVEENPPAEETKRPRGRPRKDGRPAGSSSPPKSGPAVAATAEDWSLFAWSVTQATIMAGDVLHTKNPNFPNTEEWKKRRGEATLMLAKKYGSGMAKYSVEFNFCMAWMLSIACMVNPKQKLSMNLANLLPKAAVPATAPPPPAPPHAPPEPEQPEVLLAVSDASQTEQPIEEEKKS